MKPVRLIGPHQRAYAAELLARAEDGMVMTLRKPKRSLDQNARMWAMINDVANAEPEGRQWEPETWKCAFLHYLGHRVRFEQSLDDSGPFPAGFRSSHLSVEQMSQLIDCIDEWGTRHGVQWTERDRGGWR